MKIMFDFSFYSWALFTVVVLGLTGCGNDDGAAVFDDRPVVEAYLKTGAPVEVSITQLIAFSESSTYEVEDVNQLLVAITSGAETHTLAPQGEGRFLNTDSNLVIAPDSTYGLTLYYGERIVTAETTVPAFPTGFEASVTSMTIEPFIPGSGTFPTFPDPLALSWDNPDASYYLVVVENIETDPAEVNEREEDDNRPERVFRIEPTQSNTLEIRSQQFAYYGTHLLILHHLNPEYALLYDESGTNSQNLTDPSSNVSNGLGIFTGLSSDTIQFEVREP